MSERFIVFVLVWAAGLIVIVFALVAPRRNIYVDANSGQPLSFEVELPGYFKAKTNMPSIAALILSALLIA